MINEKRKYPVIHAGNDAESKTLFRQERIGRNEPCPCGSGKKAKNCCGTDARYTYRKHVNYIIEESDVREDMRFKTRKNDKGEIVKISRWCYDGDQLVIVNEHCTDKTLVEKKAKVVERGLCHDFLQPYYIVQFEDSDKVFERWINENYLSPIIM